MPETRLVILYVHSPTASARFYENLLGRQAIEASPTFALVPLRDDGMGLGLWSRHTVEPRPGAAGGGSEIAFLADDVDALHAEWAALGIAMAQPPTDLDFGRTFVALDPDGNRLRVFRPVQA